MDASTLTFPKSALCARRPDGMIEYALYDVSNDTYRLVWSTVIDGTEQHFAETVTPPQLQDEGHTLDVALELRRDKVLAHFQQLEAGPEPQ